MQILKKKVKNKKKQQSPTFFQPKKQRYNMHPKQKEEDRDNYRILLRDINVMLSICMEIISGASPQKLKQLGSDIMSHIRTAFLDNRGQPWISVNPSLHTMCAHAWQLFEISWGQPISVYSEQAQEHWNKNIIKYKRGCGARSRQHIIKLNLRDIVSRDEETARLSAKCG